MNFDDFFLIFPSENGFYKINYISYSYNLIKDMVRRALIAVTSTEKYPDM